MKRIAEFIVFYILWLLLTWSLSGPQLIAGAVISLIVTLLVGDFFPDDFVKFLNPVRLFWFLVYVPYFLWFVLVANLDVAYRVLHLGLPINPGIIKVKTSLSSKLGKTVLANSITLTPGTLTVDTQGDYLYVHWINVSGEDSQERTEKVIGRFERILTKVFE